MPGTMQHLSGNFEVSVADRVVARAQNAGSGAVPADLMVREAEELAQDTLAAIRDARDGAILASVVEAIPGARTTNAFLEAIGDKIACLRGI